MEDCFNMKRTKGKGRIFQTIVAICVVFSMVLASSSISYARTCAIPTIDSKFATLAVGNNQFKVEYYDGSQIIAGRFVAPEKNYYTIYVVNNGELEQIAYLLNEDFVEISTSYYATLTTTKQYTFGTFFLEKGEMLYFYTRGRNDRNTIGTLASKVVINKKSDSKSSDVQANSTNEKNNKNNTSVSKSKTAISKKSCLLKKGKKIKLKLKNNKKKVIWVSREKKIASVTSKGVVKGRKKGTTYIYAIANHKLYKCKLKVC